MAESIDAKAIHSGLIDKIKAWKNEPDYKPRSHSQKLKRSLNLLAGTNPEVLVHLLGVKEVPARPRDAMNVIRGLDLKTLKKLEIFTGGGMKKGDKIVGHHKIAANTIGEALAGMSPDQRMQVYAGIAARGEKIGMDPRQIIQIWDETHQSVAHGGDLKGKKTGAWLGYIAGEDAAGFLERFDKSVEIQKRMAEAAQEMKINQVLEGGIKGASAGAGILDVSDANTPIEYKGKATTIFSNWTDPIRDILKTAQSPQEAFDRVGELVSEGVENLPTRSKNMLNAMRAARPNAGSLVGGITGNVVGARPGLADLGDIADATSSGNYTNLAVNTGVGAATGAAVQKGVQVAQNAGMGWVGNAVRAMGMPLAAFGIGTGIAEATFRNPRATRAYMHADNPIDRFKALGAAWMSEEAFYGGRENVPTDDDIERKLRAEAGGKTHSNTKPGTWQDNMFDGEASEKDEKTP